jgi:hypothetical protein
VLPPWRFRALREIDAVRPLLLELRGVRDPFGEAQKRARRLSAVR